MGLRPFPQGASPLGVVPRLVDAVATVRSDVATKEAMP